MLQWEFKVMKYRGGSVKTTACLTFLFLFLLVTLSTLRNSTKHPGLGLWRLNYSVSGHIEAITCNSSNLDYDLCTIGSQTLLDPTTATFFAVGSTSSALVKTRPYPRKRDKRALSDVREITLSSSPPDSTCGVTHASPALVFSTGGYTGNFFHDFNDGLIPLFITVNSLFPDHDVVLVISDFEDWWAQKYKDLLPHFTRHRIVNMEREISNHCFPSAIVGLIKHGHMKMDPPKTLVDFSAFLEQVYKPVDSTLTQKVKSTRPRLVLVNRRGDVGRLILNLEQVKNAAMDVGFEVLTFEPNRENSLAESFRLIHGSHAMMGVHGAGLTHLLFLRPGSVLLQVVPISTDWLSQTYFEDPAREIGLEYINYKITANESSLSKIYGPDDLVVKDPEAYTRGDFSKMKIYLKTQNVEIDLVRFQRYLEEAYGKAKILFDKEG
ncbi:hypothetical protein HS088_TW22G00853 [Tripterygium wilfordii]|uniref:Glycosyltransferase 61 catalytic domain-containing protein n=1 Tax=Tripterygium wilfordii TaxID=458696 RepID=A0A7J7BZR0_TRIWF|nr:hypothetical protein HS088_TW22G00853 [Tripterygium wilfordii]